MKEAVDELTGDEYAGSRISMKDIEDVAKKYGVDSHELSKAVLQDGIDNDWLVDEFFEW